jgi:hypothetical protein
MADCEGVLILNNEADDEQEAIVLMFSKKTQIIWTAMRLLYMLISRSNRIGDNTHIMHMDTESGLHWEDEDETE